MDMCHGFTLHEDESFASSRSLRDWFSRLRRGSELIEEIGVRLRLLERISAEAATESAVAVNTVPLHRLFRDISSISSYAACSAVASSSGDRICRHGLVLWWVWGGANQSRGEMAVLTTDFY